MENALLHLSCGCAGLQGAMTEGKYLEVCLLGYICACHSWRGQHGSLTIGSVTVPFCIRELPLYAMLPPLFCDLTLSDGVHSFSKPV